MISNKLTRSVTHKEIQAGIIIMTVECKSWGFVVVVVVNKAFKDAFTGPGSTVSFIYNLLLKYHHDSKK